MNIKAVLEDVNVREMVPKCELLESIPLHPRIKLWSKHLLLEDHVGEI
jgi:hypothetical protein